MEASACRTPLYAGLRLNRMGKTRHAVITFNQDCLAYREVVLVCGSKSNPIMLWMSPPLKTSGWRRSRGGHELFEERRVVISVPCGDATPPSPTDHILLLGRLRRGSPTHVSTAWVGLGQGGGGGDRSRVGTP